MRVLLAATAAAPGWGPSSLDAPVAMGDPIDTAAAQALAHARKRR